MKVSPLVTSNVFNVLPVEETKDKGSCIFDCENNIGRTFICSIHLESKICLNVEIKVADMHAKIEVEALLDSSATGLFINHALVQNNGIATCVLDHPIPVYNIDGSLNRGGSITEEVTLIMAYQGHQEKAIFEVCHLGKANLIIAYTWLCKNNSDINLETGKVHLTHCPKECNVYLK
jgi:Retroviral aspartyl protease